MTTQTPFLIFSPAFFIITFSLQMLQPPAFVCMSQTSVTLDALLSLYVFQKWG